MDPSAHTLRDVGPWRVRWQTSTGSTNADLLELARGGEPSGLVLVADEQTAGRGRLGRTWEAPRGANLLASLLFRPAELDPPIAVGQLHQLTQAVALAAADACESVAGVRPSLKWPNDLLIDDRKLAGILAEAVVEGAVASAVVVGIGLNVGAAPEGAASLQGETGRSVDRVELLDAMLRAVDVNSAPDRYRHELATLGRRVRVLLPGDIEFVGVASGVTPDGLLVVVDDAGRSREFAVGDVVHLRPAG